MLLSYSFFCHLAKLLDCEVQRLEEVWFRNFWKRTAVHDYHHASARKHIILSPQLSPMTRTQLSVTSLTTNTSC